MPDPVPLPEGLSFFLNDGFVLVLSHTADTLNMGLTNGNDGSCSAGRITGAIWTGRGDYLDSSKLVQRRYVISVSGATMTLTDAAAVAETWAAASERQADQALQNTNPSADPAAGLIGWCKFTSKRWN